MDLDVYIILLIGLCLMFAMVYRFYKPKSTPEIFSDQGEFVTLNSKVATNVVFADVQKLKKTEIVKIQLSGPCLSLFNKSNHTIDIWVNEHVADQTFTEAAAIFPHAEKIVIES